MSFHEKSAWACLISLTVVYVPYFWLVLRFPMAAIGLFWVSAIVLVVLLAVSHAVSALATRSIRAAGRMEPVDELDQKIELQAAKWAGLILGIGILTWVLIAMFLILRIGANDGLSAASAVPKLAAMAAVQWLFATFVLANAIYYGAIALRYRRMAVA
jgi:hypothetical protein